MTRRSAAIGDKRDAHERVVSFAERFKAFMGRPPAEVVVFAEDFAALDLESFRSMPYRVVRGPSVQEYRW
jgi:hypothetical protein